jgi:hypothetical protein
MKYLLATILAIVMTGQTFADDYIVIVFDSSGSMDNRMRSVKDQPIRMDVAKTALIEVVSQVSDNTKVGILTFGGWAYELQSVDRAKLKQAVQQIRPGGGTPLYEYIRAGATTLLEERAKQLNKGNYRLVIVTDGEAGDEHLNSDDTFRDGTPKLGVMNDISRRNIGVDAIGLDMTGEHAISQIIRSKNLGTYMAGNDPKSLTQSLQKAVAEVSLDSKDTGGEDIFKELEELPDEFFTVAVAGLTTNQNHPIGEKPPVVMVSDEGVTTTVPDPMNEEVPAMGEDNSGSSFGLFALIGAAIACGVVVLLLKAGR